MLVLSTIRVNFQACHLYSKNTLTSLQIYFGNLKHQFVFILEYNTKALQKINNKHQRNTIKTCKHSNKINKRPDQCFIPSLSSLLSTAQGFLLAPCLTPNIIDAVHHLYIRTNQQTFLHQKPQCKINIVLKNIAW